MNVEVGLYITVTLEERTPNGSLDIGKERSILEGRQTIKPYTIVNLFLSTGNPFGITDAREDENS